MILGWARFIENLATYDRAMGGLGQTVRHADQLGTILAAHDTALYDTPVTLDHAVARIEGLDIDNYIAGTDESAHADCLSHLLSTIIAVEFTTGGTSRMTIGEIVGKAFRARRLLPSRVAAKWAGDAEKGWPPFSTGGAPASRSQ